MSDMWTVHLRLAHLWHIKKQREWTEEEEKDYNVCMDANLNKAMRLQRLKNLSLVASMTNDSEWNMDICRQIDNELERMR